MTSSNGTFPRYWPFVRGIHRSPVNSPYKGQWRGALMFSLICAWINGWVKIGEAGDLRRHRAYYDVTLMLRSIATIVYCTHRYLFCRFKVVGWEKYNEWRSLIILILIEKRYLLYQKHAHVVFRCGYPDSKVHGANMGPTWVLSAPDGPHVGPMNLAIRVGISRFYSCPPGLLHGHRNDCSYCWHNHNRLTPSRS